MAIKQQTLSIPT